MGRAHEEATLEAVPQSEDFESCLESPEREEAVGAGLAWALQFRCLLCGRTGASVGWWVAGPRCRVLCTLGSRQVSEVSPRRVLGSVENRSNSGLHQNFGS